jgi:Rad3-related DNA helicase
MFVYPWNSSCNLEFVHGVALMLQILFISPERLFSESFFSAMDGLPQISLAVVDEAHCLSEWYVESEESRNKPFVSSSYARSWLSNISSLRQV